MFTTKYSKNQPKPAKKPVKKFQSGGYVDPEIYRPEDDIDVDAAKGRIAARRDGFVADLNAATAPGDKSRNRFTPAAAIDKIAAKGRIRATDESNRDNEIVSRGRK